MDYCVCYELALPRTLISNSQKKNRYDVVAVTRACTENVPFVHVVESPKQQQTGQYMFRSSPAAY
jgi:hypothetical protein